MATLTVDFIMSLDGYGAAEGWPGWWGLEGPEYFAWLDEVPDNDAPILMGATTYEVMSGFAASESEGVEALDAVPKYVFSSHLTAPLAWANSTLVSGDAIEFVRDLKASTPGRLRTLGSVSLCRSLLVAGFVDRFRVVVFPVITGRTGAERIFDHYPDVALDLVDSRTFDHRSQLLEYVPTVLERAPLAT